jgi:diguanylate cyclase
MYEQMHHHSKRSSESVNTSEKPNNRVTLNKPLSRDQNLLTLAFKNDLREKQFFDHNFARTVSQGRIGLVVGSLLYLLFGFFDRWSIPPEHHWLAWVIRLTALVVPITIYAITYTRYFAKGTHLYLASLGFAANLGFLCIFALIPIDKLPLFYPSIALTTVATYFLIGTRFIYALSAECIVMVAYNILFISVHGLSSPHLLSILLTQDFFLLSANVIGGAAGYMQELQSRKLFIRETELLQERQKHLEKSLRDPLTGLPNRDLLHDRIHQALAQSHRGGLTHAVFFIDLDGFKAINDNLGHAVGDKVLKIVAAQLCIAVRDTDTVARLGGDEFFVLCHNITDETQAKQQALRLLDAIENIANYDGAERYRLSASIGICRLPYAGNTVDDIISRADKAMYKAKKAGGGKYAMATKQITSTRYSTRAIVQQL